MKIQYASREVEIPDLPAASVLVLKAYKDGTLEVLRALENMRGVRHEAALLTPLSDSDSYVQLRHSTQIR